MKLRKLEDKVKVAKLIQLDKAVNMPALQNLALW
jgi:hypothetical protein